MVRKKSIYGDHGKVNVDLTFVWGALEGEALFNSYWEHGKVKLDPTLS